MPLIATRGAASAQGFGEFGAVAGPANYIEDVFLTYLYTGNGSTQTITNGIDLAGKGGLVWIKDRTQPAAHILTDTARGPRAELSSNQDSAQFVTPAGTDLTAFNASGFNLGSNWSGVNSNGIPYVSWTFRKQAKFFDVVTYTGNGVSNRDISHSLGSVPGCIIIKRTDASDDWKVYHRGWGFPGEGGALNSTAGFSSTYKALENVDPTATTFRPATPQTNTNGATYVAYLFAHNAGGFGLTGTDNVISCGSYTGNGAAGNTINLGYEPQFLMVKRANAAADWFMLDNMRGIITGGNDAFLWPNRSFAENGDAGFPFNAVDLTSTGFAVNTANSIVNASGNTYIYIAIRRGPMKVPTSGTSVFAPVVYAGNGTSQTITTGFANDMEIIRRRGSAENNVIEDKLRGSRVLFTNTTDSELTSTGDVTGYTNTGFDLGASNQGSTNDGGGPSYISWNFRRAPGFFDEVCYTGTGSATTQAHNLGVVPELMIVKIRNQPGAAWAVYSAASGNTKVIRLNTTAAQTTSSVYWNNTTPTASVFTVGNDGDVNNPGDTYVAYLFASCPGVSKVGSYTGNGSSQTINCGFTGGARFVLIKRTDSTGNWMVVDTARGLVAAGDPTLYLNSTAAEVTGVDWLDPASSGFIVNQEGTMNANVNGGTYIFLAIA